MLPDSPTTTAPEAAPKRARQTFFVACFGLVHGTVVSVAAQIALRMTDTYQGIIPLARHRVAGAVLLGCAHALVAAAIFGAIALVARRARAERISLFVAAALAILAGTHVLGTVLVILTGSPLTSSGLAYFMNSSAGIGREVLRRFPLHLAGIALAITLLGALAQRGLRFALVRAKRPIAWRSAAPAFAMVAVAALALAQIRESAFFAGVKILLPEAAFAASTQTRRLHRAALGTRSNEFMARALESPGKETEGPWRLALDPKKRRPNVVLVVAEAIRVHHLGYMGNTRATTPNLDRLAKDSLRFDHAYTTATHSNYAQMSILSSLFPRRGSTLDMYQKLHYPRMLLHDVAYAAGMRTATISSQDETWQGMKRFEDTGTPTYFRHSPDHEGPHLDIGTEHVVPDEETVTHALGWIDQQRGETFSLYVNLQATHFPYELPASAPRPFKPYDPRGAYSFVGWDASENETVRNRYDNAVHYVDAQVGRLVEGLRERNLLDSTIFVFTADHGELFHEHGLVTHARSLHEGEARVPIIVRSPGAVDRAVVTTPVSTLDILPTILDYAGIPPHPSHQGRSLRPGAATPEPAVFMNIQGWTQQAAVVCYPYKYILDEATGAEFLYDIAADPDETTNLMRAAPDTADLLADVLDAQLRAQVVYHEGEAELWNTHFAPRLLACPPL